MHFTLKSRELLREAYLVPYAALILKWSTRQGISQKDAERMRLLNNVHEIRAVESQLRIAR